jgi:1-deoxy-D-xylulose-5-phosphate synthase
MGIDPNTGALNTQLQSNPEKVKPYFEWFGLAYSGPINGHNLQALIPALQQAYQTKGPRMLHIKTTKGKGHPAAEKEQTKWHSAAKFVKIEPASTPSKKWQDVFGELLVVLAKKHPNLAGITPAMPSSCGMIHAMNQFPNRFFDVGIAEQHALTFAAGMATQGLIPVVNIYSSFLQRGYDQYIHDIALQNLPVILCVDRAGLVGEDGPTHHGAFDMAFMGCIPNTTLVAPRNAQELAAAMQWGINLKAPIAIRYPKGNLSESQWTDQAFENPEKTLITQYLHKTRESDILILSTGHASNLVQLAHKYLHHTPFDHLHCPIYSQTNQLLLSGNLSLSQYKHIITVEDGCIQGGWGQSMCQTLNQLYDVTITHLGIPNDFIEHGNNEEDLYPLCGYSPRDIAQTVIKFQRNG